MTKQVTHYEVLLFFNTYFAQTRFCEKNNCNWSQGSGDDRLHRGCWTGLILQLLPAFLSRSSKKNSVCVWEVIPAENFIEGTLGDSPCCVEYNSSVNPYLFSLYTKLQLTQ
jgi:hypothetical protein